MGFKDLVNIAEEQPNNGGGGDGGDGGAAKTRFKIAEVLMEFVIWKLKPPTPLCN